MRFAYYLCQNRQEEVKFCLENQTLPMDYVLGIVTSFTMFNAKEVTLKARGQAITTAVDAVEITRCRFVKELRISKIIRGEKNPEEMPPRRR